MRAGVSVFSGPGGTCALTAADRGRYPLGVRARTPEGWSVKPEQPSEVTRLLRGWRDGDRAALDALLPLVYEELRRLAHAHLRKERPDHTLQSAALVNEAYLRLIGLHSPRWESRTHF